MFKKNPTNFLVSVIIPTYNRKRLLMETLESVFLQTHSNLEVIVVDDGSCDGTEGAIKKMSDPRLRYEKLPNNRGVHFARNKGIERATGDFLSFLDSDDELVPHAISTAIEVFKEVPDLGVVAGLSRSKEGTLFGITATQPSCISFEDLLCKRIFRKEGKELFRLVRAECVGNTRYAAQHCDFIFWQSIASQYSTYFIPVALKIYNSSADNGRLHVLRKKMTLERYVEKAEAVERFIHEHKETFLATCTQLYASYAYTASIGMALDKRKVEARQLALEAYSYDKKKLRHLVLLILLFIPWGIVAVKVAFLFRRMILK